MLCVTIPGPSYEEAVQQILSLPFEVDLLEFRLDNFTHLNEAFLTRLRDIRSVPVIFTLRDPKQGSHYKGTETERLRDLQRYAGLNPDYLDLESTCPPDFVEHIAARHPQTKIILSYHNWDETPVDLDSLLTEMRQIPAFLYKIATYCNTSCDALRILKFMHNHTAPISAMGMGEHGEITRILGPVYGSAITYASATDDLQMIKGQLSAQTLLSTYNYTALHSGTAVYGLIGNPVSKSISQYTHNAVFRELSIPAVYIKMIVSAKELDTFIPLAKELNFQGLSVTMPLKEAILKYLDFTDPYAQSIGAVNTLCYTKEGIFGYNTDGIGALDAIEHTCYVEGKSILMIGAGGAAKAIAAEALRRGAHVTVLNRNAARLQELATQYPIIPGVLNDIAEYMKKGYDILINCTPEPVPFDLRLLLPGKIVMDIKTFPKENLFTETALKKECKIIYGYQMFIGQALEQFHLWFSESFHRGAMLQFLENHAKSCL